jgi:Na+/H+-dicarboxylate symporter
MFCSNDNYNNKEAEAPMANGIRMVGPAGRVSLALATGLAIGVAISVFGTEKVKSDAAGIEFIGTLWINAIRMTVIPLIISLLVTTVSSFADLKSAGRNGGRLLLLFVVFMAGSVVVAVLLVPPLFAWLSGGSHGLAAHNDISSASVADQVHQLPTVTQWVTDLVPTNPFRAAADGALLPLVIFSVLLGLASTRISPERRESLIRFFQALGDTMTVIIGWLIALAPIGVFALVLPLVIRTGVTAVGAVGTYLLVTVLAVSLLSLLVYPIVALVTRKSIARFALAALPAQIVAASTLSSLATLPTMLDAMKRYGCPARVSGFSLPLAVSLFRFSTPVTWMTAALLVARLYDVSFGLPQMVVIALAGATLSFGGAGIPMGALLILAPAFSAVGLPVEGIGVLLAVDLVPDMFRTLSNVTGDMAVAAVLSRRDLNTADVHEAAG